MDPLGLTPEVVLDASVFVDLMVKGRDGRAGRHLEGITTYVVPPIFDAEVIRALRRRRMRGEDGGRLLAGVAEALHLSLITLGCLVGQRARPDLPDRGPLGGLTRLGHYG